MHPMGQKATKKDPKKYDGMRPVLFTNFDVNACERK